MVGGGEEPVTAAGVLVAPPSPKEGTNSLADGLKVNGLALGLSLKLDLGLAAAFSPTSSSLVASVADCSLLSALCRGDHTHTHT